MTAYNDNATSNSDNQGSAQTSDNQESSNRESDNQTTKVTVNNAPDANPATLWLIDDDAALRLVLADTFEDAGLTVISFTKRKRRGHASTIFCNSRNQPLSCPM